MRDRRTLYRCATGRRHGAVSAAGFALVLAAAWSGLGVGDSGAAAEQRTFPEYEVKAAFLLNFTRYVTWPQSAFAEPEEPLVIGILGQDPFGALIDETVAGRLGDGGRPIEVRRLSEPAAAAACHIVFISRAERHQAALLESLDSRAILTVGESERFLRDGGGINLSIDRNSRVSFEVNLEATDRAGLTLSLHMLNLADRVLRPAQEGEHQP